MKRLEKKTGLILLIALLVSAALYGGGKKDNPVPSNGSASGGIPPYLNTGNTFPIVKPGENITLTVATVYNSALGGRTEDLWFWKFAKEKMNINFQVEQIMDSAAQERKNLMFASGDLKDLIFNIGLTNSDLVTYGQSEHLLYDLNSLLTPELAPNLLVLMDKFPELRAAMSCPDGGMYTFPKIGLVNDPGSVIRLFINTEWLQKTGVKTPETLDEFYNVLKAFKEKDPSGTGKIVPLGGNSKTNSPEPYILSALGFITSSTASEPALRNGRVEIPAGSPVYKDYLSFMNRLYTERLIDENFFTMDRSQVNVQMAEKRVGVIQREAPYVVLPNIEDFQKYQALSPVTSAFNSKKIWAGPNSFITGTAVMSAKAKYPEVAMRFWDWIYSQEGGVYSWNGAPAYHEGDTLGLYRGWSLSADGAEVYPDVEAGKSNSGYEFVLKYITPFSGTMGNRSDILNDKRVLCGLEPLKETLYDLSKGDPFYRKSVTDHILPYVAAPFPSNIYFTAEENIRLADLKTVITDYVEKESAKFITGANSLSNMDKYYSDLNTLGFREYQNLYTDAYNAYLGNLKKSATSP
jgi:putative aldouronate transport system substrate-binding protein